MQLNNGTKEFNGVYDKMNVKQLIEMPGYQDKHRLHLNSGIDFELGKKLNLKTLEHESIIPIKKPYAIIPFNHKFYQGLPENLAIHGEDE